jgi:starch synthase (maltosyl-transferring)
LHSDASLAFHRIDNDQLICYSKVGAGGSNIVLVVVNLDPEHAQSGFIDVPMGDWALDPRTPYTAHELLTNRTYEWQGPRVFVTLAPAECPACIYRIQARRATSERDFDYFA